MKKIFNMMMAVAIAAFTFTACEDVPEPYNNPYNGAKIEEPVVIDPAGSGTAEDPYNVAGINEYAKAFSSGQTDSKKVFVTGIICNVVNFQEKYGEIDYYISDDKAGLSSQFYVYGGYGLNGEKFTSISELAVGDTVTVEGTITNYNNTLEFQYGSKIISLKRGNGESPDPITPDVKTVGSKDAPKTVAEALTAINAMEDGSTSEEFWFVKGKVVKVTTSAENFETYKNLNYLISEDGTENNTITVYAGNGLDNAQFTGIDALKAGDEVVVYGQIQKYVNKSGAMTPEIAKGNYLVSYKAGGNGETSATTATVAQFLAAAESTSEWYQLTGTVTHLEDGTYKNSTQYGNFDLVDETGSIYVYGVVSEKGGSKGQFAALMSEKGIKDGSKITIIGNRGSYKGNAQVVNAYFVNVENSGTPTPVSNTGSLDNPLSASQAYDIVAAMEASVTSDADYYVKGKICSIRFEYSSNYGTATFNISDDGNTGTKEFIAYNCYYFGNQSWKDGNTQIKVGDEVIVCGKVVNYNGNTPEFASKKNYLVSLNGKTSDDGNNQGGGQASGASISVTYGDLGITSLNNAINLSDGTTLTFAQEDGNNAPVYHEGTKIVRMYARNSVTINAGSKKIASVIFNYDTYNGTAYKGNDELYGEAGSNKITPTIDDKTVTFSNVNNSTLKVVNAFAEKNSGGTQFRCTGLTINYAN